MPDTDARIRALPIWRDPDRIRWQPLAGGISNQSYVVVDASNAGTNTNTNTGADAAGLRRYVVRFGRDFPFHHVFREREAVAARAAHAAGFAPELIYTAPGVMVSRFIDGRTYGEADVRADLERIAVTLRRFHREMPRHLSGPGMMFWPFHVIRDYVHTLRQGDSRLRHRLDEFLTLNDELEAAQTPLPIVFGHHDLLPANFIDDGERLWLIDFEYAALGTPMFDLAGVSANAGFDAGQCRELLRVYFERDPEPALVRSHAAMACAALLREALWSLVSERYLDLPGVDYVAYGDEQLHRLAQALDRYRGDHA